eukprot:2200169-Amphidinium_carterae.1
MQMGFARCVESVAQYDGCVDIDRFPRLVKDERSDERVPVMRNCFDRVSTESRNEQLKYHGNLP